MKVRFLLSTLLVLNLIACAQSKNSSTYDYEVVVDDIAIPWGFTFLPDGSMLINEKSGKLYHFNKGIKSEISGLPYVTQLGQGGLMDIELHPQYSKTKWIYFSYASSSNNNSRANTTIMRAKLEGNKLVEQQVLYKATPDYETGQHFGSRLVFDRDGYLYFSIGERGKRDLNPQDITRDCGKIYRLNDDGTVPADNPFANNPAAKPAIYSYGHRNPQGMAIHPETGKIWAHEHGPKGGDEINIIEAGKNYGWPVISYGINYNGTRFTDKTSASGMEQPIHYWVPSIAPSGMVFVTSDVYPNWKGNLLVGSLKFQYLNRCTMDGEKVASEEKLLEGLGRVRSIEQGPDGYIYAGIENLGIVKIIPKKY